MAATVKKKITNIAMNISNPKDTIMPYLISFLQEDFDHIRWWYDTRYGNNAIESKKNPSGSGIGLYVGIDYNTGYTAPNLHSGLGFCSKPSLTSRGSDQTYIPISLNEDVTRNLTFYKIPIKNGILFTVINDLMDYRYHLNFAFIYRNDTVYFISTDYSYPSQKYSSNVEVLALSNAKPHIINVDAGISIPTSVDIPVLFPDSQPIVDPTKASLAPVIIDNVGALDGVYIPLVSPSLSGGSSFFTLNDKEYVLASNHSNKMSIAFEL